MTAREPSLPTKEQEWQIPPEGRKVTTCHSTGGTRSLVPSRHTEAQCFMLYLPVEGASLLSHSCNPSTSTEWHSAILLVLEVLCPHSAQRPNIPQCDCRRALAPPSKSKNSSPLAEEKKEVIGTTTRTLQGYNIQRTPLWGILWEHQERKNPQNPTPGAQGIKSLTQNNSRCMNLCAEWNSKTTHSPSKANSTSEDWTTCVEEELWNNELKNSKND
jgi:hypothetical protein